MADESHDEHGDHGHDEHGDHGHDEHGDHGHDEHGDHGHGHDEDLRVTSPMQEFSTGQVGVGFAVLVAGLLVTFAVPLLFA